MGKIIFHLENLGVQRFNYICFWLSFWHQNGKLWTGDDNDNHAVVDDQDPFYLQGDGVIDDDGDGSGACLQSSGETMEPLGRSGERSKVFEIQN